MVQVAGVSRALESLKASLGRTFFLGVGTFLLLLLRLVHDPCVAQ